MDASIFWVDGARLVVSLAAGAVVIPLMRRSADRRSTCLTIFAGIALTLAPNVLHLCEAIARWTPRPPLNLLGRVDSLGFALILLGVVLGLRRAARAGEELRKENAVLKQQASTDFLTGLLNRRQVDLLLGYGASRARRSGEPLGFVMIDLDHFKTVNDTFGHQAGDAVLVHVASLLKSRLRGSDMIARYGGEEFLVVLTDPNPEGVVLLADDLRRLIEQNPANCDGQSVPVTASFGVAVSLVNTEEAVQECIGKADAALYAAKSMGRNRVVAWEPSLDKGDAAAKRDGQQSCSPPHLKVDAA